MQTYQENPAAQKRQDLSNKSFKWSLGSAENRSVHSRQRWWRRFPNCVHYRATEFIFLLGFCFLGLLRTCGCDILGRPHQVRCVMQIWYGAVCHQNISCPIARFCTLPPPGKQNPAKSRIWCGRPPSIYRKNRTGLWELLAVFMLEWLKLFLKFLADYCTFFSGDTKTSLHLACSFLLHLLTAMFLSL